MFEIRNKKYVNVVNLFNFILFNITKYIKPKIIWDQIFKYNINKQ